MNYLHLLAQAAEQEDQSIIPMLAFFALVGVAFYFFILMPQKKEETKRRELISSLKKGDKVVTAGGIHGTVVDAKSTDTVTIDIAKGVHVVFNRASVSVIDLPKETETNKTTKSEPTKSEANKTKK
ncbi:MAG: preprotein translocase subunit YajC [Sumerlaeia bacterium]